MYIIHVTSIAIRACSVLLTVRTCTRLYMADFYVFTQLLRND